MSIKREYIYVVNYTDDSKYMAKFTTEIYRNCIAKSYEDVTYDQFRYMLRRSNFKRLTTQNAERNIISVYQK